MALLYGFVVLIATTLGAMSGMGGGVIIKPALDLIAIHDVYSIGFYSSCAVLSMAIINIIKHLKSDQSLNYKMIGLISVGSTLGGVMGSHLLGFLLSQCGNDTIRMSQSILLVVILLLVVFLVSSHIMTFHFKSSILTLAIGMVLGLLSSYLGIGGGPLNVAVFCLLFSVNFKTATIYSIATILFSQIASLLTIATTTGFHVFDLTLLFTIVPFACLGGLVGSKLNHLLSSKVLKVVFNLLLISLIILNIYNIFNV